MKTNNRHSILHYSLFAALIGIMPMAAFSAIRVGNHSRSYAEAYNQVNAQVAAANSARVNAAGVQTGTVAPVATTVAPTNATQSESAETVELPIRVANADLAKQIINNDPAASVTMGQLDRCAMIYPNGEFEWARPTLGLGAGGGSTCVAVVELRGYQMGENGSDLVLARATLASGDSIKCNISEFPDATHNNSITGNVVVPADNPPTMEDVEQVMNEEQKQNAGLKIAAGAILGGVFGNIAGANDLGEDGLLGTSRGKMQGTAIGALSGAALMAGNSYAGKKAGDIILSTGVNAAAGSLIGNIAATGDSVLRIEDCTVAGRNTSCLWGMLVTSRPLTGAETAFYNTTTQETYVCDAEMQKCKNEELVSIQLEAYPNVNIDEVIETQFQEIISKPENQYFMSNTNSGISFVPASAVDEQQGANIDAAKGIFAKLSDGGHIDRRIAAMIPDVHDKAFGMKQSDWREWKRTHQSGVIIYGRSTQGQSYDLSDTVEYSINDFYPMMVDASDGGIIDYSNKARLKTTLIGAGAGGAMGAFVGYQGAQSDIENRWTAAAREYKDSLTKFYCATGNRYLSQYNDVVYIPEIASE